jgi:hypothetical protein
VNQSWTVVVVVGVALWFAVRFVVRRVSVWSDRRAARRAGVALPLYRYARRQGRQTRWGR